MADLAGALEEFISAGFEPAVSLVPTNAQMAPAMDAVEALYPTRRRAARAAGVSPETWRRWRLGTQRPGPRARAAFVSVGRWASGLRLFGAGAWKLTATVRVSNDVRERTLHVGRYLPAQVRARLVELVRREDWSDAARVIIDAIDVYYKAGLTIDEAEQITFGWEV